MTPIIIESIAVVVLEYSFLNVSLHFVLLGIL